MTLALGNQFYMSTMPQPKLKRIEGGNHSSLKAFCDTLRSLMEIVEMRVLGSESRLHKHGHTDL